jgi:hypothetical protein
MPCTDSCITAQIRSVHQVSMYAVLLIQGLLTIVTEYTDKFKNE